MRKLASESAEVPYTDDNAGLLAAAISPVASYTESFDDEHEPETFDGYTQKVIE